MLLRLDDEHFLSGHTGVWRILHRKPGRGELTRVVGTYTSVTHAWQCARATGMPKPVIAGLADLVSAHDRAEASAEGKPDEQVGGGEQTRGMHPGDA